MSALDELELDDFFDVLFNTLAERLMFYRIYPCVVAGVLDLKFSGWVDLEVPHLEANDFLSHIRAEVVQSPRSAVYPAEGDRGVLFFVNADPSLPKFLPLAGDTIDTEDLPTQTKHTLIKTGMMGSLFTVDELKGGFKIHSKSPVGTISDPSFMPLGEKVKDNFVFVGEQLGKIWEAIAALNKAVGKHIHGTGSGPSSPALTPDSVSVSTEVTAAKKEQITVKKQIASYGVPGELLSPSNECN